MSAMTTTQQPDLFSSEEQADLFGEFETPTYRADPDEVRAELHKILAEARAAHVLPWEPRKVTLYRTIFPQMTSVAAGRGSGAIALRVRDRA